MPIDAVLSTDTLQVLQPQPTATITVASGLDGKRGSYIFVALLTDPNDAADYIELTSSADVRPLEYDLYISNADGSQWQYRYDGTGQLQWYPVSHSGAGRSGGGTTTGVTKAKFAIPSTHDVTHELVHDFATNDVQVFVYRAVAPFASVDCYVERTSGNKVTLKFSDTEPVPTALTAVVVAYI